MNRLSTERAAFTVLVFSALASALTPPLGAPADASMEGVQAAPTPKPFKVTCFGDAAEQVAISNVGSGPVPAGMVMRFEIPKGSVKPVGGTFAIQGPVALPAYDGSYVFQKPLNAGDQVMISVAPKPQPSAAGSPPPWVALGSLNILATVRPCTFTIAPGTNAPAIRVEPGTIVPSP